MDKPSCFLGAILTVGLEVLVEHVVQPGLKGFQGSAAWRSLNWRHLCVLVGAVRREGSLEGSFLGLQMGSELIVLGKIEGDGTGCNLLL